MWVRGLKLIVGATCETAQVAPYVGAWIETILKRQFLINLPSHPMWVRGLKHDKKRLNVLNYASHPMWVRGLKPKFKGICPNC